MTGPLPPALNRRIVHIRQTGGATRDPLNTPVPETSRRTVWASRMDLNAADFMKAGELGVFSLTDRRYIVRAGSTPWVECDGLEDNGERGTVRGVSFHTLDGQYLEIFARFPG